MQKQQISIWRLLVSISLYWLIIAIIIPFIYRLTEQQDFFLQISEYLAIIILLADFLYHLSRSTDKSAFIKREWITLLLLFPLFSIFRILRIFRFSDLLGTPELASFGGKIDEVLTLVIERLGSIEQFQHLAHFLLEQKENIKKYLKRK